MEPLWIVPIFVLLLFIGAMFWAKEQDPFSRRWFTVKISNESPLTPALSPPKRGEGVTSVKCVAVLPKPIRRLPVIIYAHGSGGTLMNDGNILRQMAELGLATVSLEYNQTNEAAFALQFEALLRYLDRQKWAKTNAIAWVGFSLGANRMWDFALKHPRRQPRLLVQLSGAGLSPSSIFHLPSSGLRCPTLLVHGDQDEVFPADDARHLAAVLRNESMAVTLKVLPGSTHSLQPDRKVIFRAVGEYCLTHLVGPNALQNYHSIAEWQANAPPFWLFCLPAMAWAVGWLIWRRHYKPPSAAKGKLKRYEIALRWLAAVLAVWALAVTAIHLVTPQFPVNQETLSIARRFLVQPKERAGFEYLVAISNWRGQKLEALLTDVELANYNRELINWQVNEKLYRKYVLSPVITGQRGEKFNWRRPLWEEFYPRIRHENSPEDAAQIVVRHLRARVTMADLPNLPYDVPTIWLRQITDKTGFEIIYVAALRSVGVPAQLDSHGQAEIYADNHWQPAPQPVVMSW